MLLRVHRHVMQTRRKQSRHVCRQHGELSACSTVRFPCYSWIRSVAEIQGRPDRKHTEGITAPQDTVELLKFLGRHPVQPALVAHDLDLMSILHEIEEYQFAPSKSIGTYPTYWPKYNPAKAKNGAYHERQPCALQSGHFPDRRTESGILSSSTSAYLGEAGGTGLKRNA